MPELTIAELASLESRAYVDEIKARLRDDNAWVLMLDPVLCDRTRWGLVRIINSIDAQKQRADGVGPTHDKWLVSVNALRRHAKRRLDMMVPVESVHLGAISTSKEARAWRAFSARLAVALHEGDSSALDSLTTPYGGLTARQWMTAREQKATAK